MLDNMLLNIKINIKFFRRNKLLISFALLFFLLASIGVFMSSFYLSSSSKHFEMVKSIYSMLNMFTYVLSAGFVFFFISDHLKSRNVKMVVTKPCSPEAWLLSGFLSAALLALGIYLIILIFVVIFSLLWGIPLQSGFLFITLYSFIKSVILMSYISFLVMVLNPVVAVMVILFFNENTFYSLKFMVMSAVESGSDGLLMQLTKFIIDAIYMFLPIFAPYAKEIAPIEQSIRVGEGNWGYLLSSAGYMLVVATLFMLLSNYYLRKKKLI